MYLMRKRGEWVRGMAGFCPSPPSWTENSLFPLRSPAPPFHSPSRCLHSLPQPVAR